MLARHLIVPVILHGVLLAGAPPYSLDPVAGKRGGVHWFELTESRQEITRRLGPPRLVAEFGPDFVSWQYHLNEGDDHDPSHVLVFRRSTGVLVSVTRFFERERSVEALFPTQIVRYAPATGLGAPAYPFLLRSLPGQRLLMAMGVDNPNHPTGQLVLMHRSVVKEFYPWMAD